MAVGASVEGSIKVKVDALAVTVAQRLNRILDIVETPEPEEEPLEEDWRTYAACAFTYNSGVKGNTSMTDHRANILRLRLLCQGCPVARECLDYADTQHPRIQDGVWGGMTWGQRRNKR